MINKKLMALCLLVFMSISFASEADESNPLTTQTFCESINSGRFSIPAKLKLELEKITQGDQAYSTAEFLEFCDARIGSYALSEFFDAGHEIFDLYNEVCADLDLRPPSGLAQLLYDAELMKAANQLKDQGYPSVLIRGLLAGSKNQCLDVMKGMTVTDLIEMEASG